MPHGRCNPTDEESRIGAPRGGRLADPRISAGQDGLSFRKAERLSLSKLAENLSPQEHRNDIWLEGISP